MKYRYTAEEELDTRPEQARALLHDLRESFGTSYLTLISIIEGVMLALMFDLILDRKVALHLHDVETLLFFNNAILIVLVWNEYRMGSTMFRWVPTLVDALIPFVVGGLQGAVILATPQPSAWIGWLAAFYLAAIVAYENMYRRAAEEERNAFVLERSRVIRRVNVGSCMFVAFCLGALAVYHGTQGTQPGWATLLFATLIHVLFVLRGEVVSRVIIRAARAAAA